MSLTWVPILPVWLIAVIAAALAVLLIHGSLVLFRKKVPGRWIAYLFVLRVVAVVVLVLCLLQPTVLYRHDEERGPDLIVMVDTSKSMATPVNADGSGPTRLRDAMDRLRSSGLEKSLSDKFTLRWFAFDGDARPLDAAAPSGIAAAGETTRLGDSLATAWSYYRQTRARESVSDAASGRVLLITDGVDHGAQDAVAEAQRLGVTIDTVVPKGPAAEREGKRLSIAGVQSARRVLMGSESRFLVTLRQHGIERAPLKLLLTEDGEKVATMEFTFNPGQDERQIVLNHRPRMPGLKKYVISVDTGGPAAQLPEVKPYEMSAQVIGHRSEVLVLQDTWRWDFKFLRRVFEDDPSFSFTSFLPRGEGTFMHFGEPDRKVNPAGPPRTKAEIDWYDTIVLGDFRPGAWSPALLSGIAKMVAEDGKSLVVVAGPNIARLAQVPELAQLLPVEITEESSKPTRGPVDVRLTAEARQSPLFFSPTTGAAAQRWNALPAMDQVYAPLRKRPAATILVEASKEGNTYGNLIVIAEHTVGRGRVVYVGTDTLWKWQTMGSVDESGNTPYVAFWQQTLRALGPGRLHEGSVSLWVQPDRTQYGTGQTVNLVTSIEADHPVIAPKVEAAVALPDGKTLPLILFPDPARPGTYTSQFDTAAPGSYRVTATLSSDGRPISDTVSAIDVLESASETGSVAIDQAALTRLAAATGGRVIDPDKHDTWPTADAAKISVPQTRRVNLWDGFWLPVLLCAVLGFDWLLRLLRGYV
ncbi:MAG: VWA domain-containing protein [Planctomycetes bacterium]|nr:VWA domain-containing protein [Planctomycetota bacterium]